MSKIGGVIVAAATVMAVGCRGKDDGASVVSIYPDTAFIGRSTELIVAGRDFRAGSAVDLGADVTVHQVQFLGPGTLLADITVEATAQPGVHPVSVDGVALENGGLTVSFPLEITLSEGTEQQGSFNLYDIKNLDPSSPFINDSGTSLAVTGGPVEVLAVAIDTFEDARVSVYFDLFAAPAPASFTLTSGGVSSHAPDVFNATATTIGTIDTVAGFTANLDQVGEVAAATLSIGIGEVIEVQATASGDPPIVVVYDGSDGSTAGIAQTLTLSPGAFFAADKATTYTLAFHDAVPFGGFPTGNATATFDVNTHTLVAESEPNDLAQPDALDGSLPALVTTTAGAGNDADFFSIDLTGMGNAAIVRAITFNQTSGGLQFADSFAKFYEDGTEIHENDDAATFMAALTAPLAGNLAQLEFSSSPTFAANDTGDYLVAVWAYPATAAADAEPNDAVAMAQVLAAAPPVFVTSTVDVDADHDFYQFTIAADARVILETGASGANSLMGADTVMTLYDGTGTEIDSNDDISFPGALWSRIDSDLTAGTYTVEIEPFDPMGSTGDYRLLIFTP